MCSSCVHRVPSRSMTRCLCMGVTSNIDDGPALHALPILVGALLLVALDGGREQALGDSHLLADGPQAVEIFREAVTPKTSLPVGSRHQSVAAADSVIKARDLPHVLVIGAELL